MYWVSAVTIRPSVMMLCLNRATRNLEAFHNRISTPAPSVACVTLDEAVVCLGRTTAAIDADYGEAVRLEAVLV